MTDIARGLRNRGRRPGLQEMKAAILTSTGRPDEAMLQGAEGLSAPRAFSISGIACLAGRAYMKRAGDYQHAIVSWSLATVEGVHNLPKAYLGQAECHLLRREWPEAGDRFCTSAATWARMAMLKSKHGCSGATRGAWVIGRAWAGVGFPWDSD